MSQRPQNIDDIYLAALEQGTTAERSAYLDRACAGDPELRRRVERLLQAQPNVGSFLESPAPELVPTVTDRPLTEAPGTVIGPYKLLEQIGEGGFGVVFMAEQTAPVKRKVALKVIKPGMDTRQVIARFEAERQALALMDHPNIAKVFDAGTTGGGGVGSQESGVRGRESGSSLTPDSCLLTPSVGRPYFVMELVRGVPITDYCDQHQLTPQQRLELFVTVCQAVQHAHQKGIIHRDIKPSNVLVTQHDDRPVVKVIDFGVAKATSGHLTDKTLFTGFAQMIGTPLYMSPEQAALSGLDIDTRSDIYSLGVLLYELLTGTTPFDRSRLEEAAFDEVRRIIREEEPQKPSTRLSSSESLPSVAANRHLEPAKLTKLVRGDLDWIVMKALEKDRARRYETANGFAADVLRYLADEPVTACPPSAAYRFRKFARRNKAVLATVAIVAAALVAGIIGTTWQAIRATREADRASEAEGLADRRYRAEKTAREQADDARAAEREQRHIADQQKQRAEANFAKARAAVDEYLSQVTESELLTVPGLQSLREDLLKAALRFYDEFTRERADDPTLQRELASAHYRLGRIHSDLGNTDAASAANAEAIRLYERLRDTGQFDRDTPVALACAYFATNRYDDTVKLCQDVLQVEATHAEARSLLAAAYNALGCAEDDKAGIEAALKYHRQAFELRESLVRDAPDNPRYLAQLGATVNNLGNLLYKQNRTEEALAMYERSVEYSQQAYERAPHSLLWGSWLLVGLSNVARTHAALGRQQDALASYQRYVAVSRKRVFENPAVTSLRGKLSSAHLKLARFQQALGNAAEAARSFREAREVLENIPRETPDQLYELATVYAALAQPAERAIEPDAEDAAERDRNVDLTLQTLCKAIDAGYANVRAIKTERLFDVLRERADFQQIVAMLEMAAQARQLASRNTGNTEQTLADRQKAAALLSDLVARQPGAARHRSTLAATLHSIGVIQTGLKQFVEAEQALIQALELRDAIQQEQPGKPDAEVDWVGTQIALGSLHWSSVRYPEGHRIWQQCTDDLRRIAEANRENTALQARIATEERILCDSYGRFGLWPLAGEYVRRSAEFRRVSAHEQDAEFAALLLLPENAGAADAYLAMLAAMTRSAAEREMLRVTHLVRTAALSRTSAVPSDELVSRARHALAIKNGDPWRAVVLAIALYRAGDHREAQDLVRGLGEIGHVFLLPQMPYVKAIIAAAIGNDSDARTQLTRSESLYRQACLESLTHPAVDSSGLPTPDWHELIHVQALRREALRLIEGQEPGDDHWQRLIQARGYRLIGENEQSDRELAAAAAASSDNPDVWMARARLLAQWDDQERTVEAAWQRAVELAGDDPVPWIQRGRWYVGRGEQEQADADFAKAFQLDPEHPLCRLERARLDHTVFETWDFSQGPAGWQALKDCKVSATNGILTIHCTGPDPFLHTKNGIKATPPGRKMLTICARFRGNLNSQLFWTTATQPRYGGRGKSVSINLTNSGGEWQEYRVVFDPGSEVRRLRFDPVEFRNDTSVQPPYTLEVAWMLLSDVSDEEVWQRAVEPAGDDPVPWIQRGRWYVGRGEQEKADADFARAAALTPNELNRFLEAGWWVVGPYPPELQEFCPPEIDPDPSTPVHIVDPRSGLSDEPVRWQSVPTGRWGRVDLASAPVRQDNASVYALAHVHSPVEQTKLLLILKSQPLRVWVNGELIEDYAPGAYPTQPHYERFHRVPMVLRAGRNSLLVKSRTADFTLRIGDAPRDRALLLAEQRRFSEAAKAFADLPLSDQFDGSGATPNWLLLVLALERAHESYERICTKLVEGTETQPASTQRLLAYFCAQTPNAVFQKHGDRFAAGSDEFVATNSEFWALHTAALVNYRAGRFERARTLLDRSILPDPILPLRALLDHQSGDQSLAEKLLDASLALAAAEVNSLERHDRLSFHSRPFWWWFDWATFLTLLHEAEQTIRNETTQTAALKQRSEAIQARVWTESPETAAFDQAMLFQSRGAGGKVAFHQPFLARARRLAELGRFDEAEADFNKAVELAPNDPDALAARGVFLADSGASDRGAADFHAALRLLEQSAERPRHAWGRSIDWEVAQRDDVFERLAELRPDDPRPPLTRMVLRMQQGDFDGMRRDGERLASMSTEQRAWAGAAALCRGDREAFDRIRATAPRSVEAVPTIRLLGLAPTEEPLTTELLQIAERMWREQPQTRWYRRWLGLAQLRAAKYTDAVASLEASLDPGHQWQQDSVHWPLLAIANHHLGNADAARRWLDKTALWLELRNAAESRRVGAATGIGDIPPAQCLYAVAFYLEARALIDGPQSEPQTE